MKTILIVASQNKGKLKEIAEILRDVPVELRSPADYPGFPAVIEDGRTLEENALKKARAGAAYGNELTLADDTGLFVDALDGAPGVYSARFSGEDGNDLANRHKMLTMMQGIPVEKRGAKFRCVMAIYHPTGQYLLVDGECQGSITSAEQGHSGFGYDPLFFVPEYGQTFAELPASTKNAISHRGRALQKLKTSLPGFLQMIAIESQTGAANHGPREKFAQKFSE
jgi:XTP/dITP diphosphohydrolase